MTTHNFKAFAAAFAFAAIFVSSAAAKCGPGGSATVNPLGRVNPFAANARPLAAPASDSGPADAAEPSIAGLWSVQFLVGKQVVDQGFDVWLSDGTEILNDSVAPSTGAVCVGTWTKTAPFTYELKHPSWIFDDTNTTLIGVLIIKETVTLDKKGASYSGTSTLYAYDLKGNPLGNPEVSVIQAQRIQVKDDPYQTSGIPGLPVFYN